MLKYVSCGSLSLRAVWRFFKESKDFFFLSLTSGMGLCLQLFLIHKYVFQKNLSIILQVLEASVWVFIHFPHLILSPSLSYTAEGCCWVILSVTGSFSCHVYSVTEPILGIFPNILDIVLSCS